MCFLLYPNRRIMSPPPFRPTVESTSFFTTRKPVFGVESDSSWKGADGFAYMYLGSHSPKSGYKSDAPYLMMYRGTTPP